MEAEQPESEEEKSIDETLSEAFDEIEQREEEPEEVVGEADEPVVDDTGSDDNPPDDDDIVAAGPEEEKEYVNPPTTWRAEAKSKWKELPTWAREEVHKREKDSLNGVTSLKDKAAYADKLDTIIQPYQPLLNSMGVTPERAVQDALNLANSLKTGSKQEKARLLRNIALQYEVDLTLEENEADKQLAPFRNEIDQLKQQLYQFQTSTQQASQQQAREEVLNFQNETNEAGELLNPYYEEVKEDMAALIELGRATTLKDAYDRACWANPEIRQIIQRQQATEDEAKRREEESKKVEKAKRASKSNLEKSPSEDLQTKPKGTMMDTLNDTYERLTAEG